jgi:hypothetical protein
VSEASRRKKKRLTETSTAQRDNPQDLQDLAKRSEQEKKKEINRDKHREAGKSTRSTRFIRCI